jgi:hypothetical protein
MMSVDDSMKLKNGRKSKRIASKDAPPSSSSKPASSRKPSPVTSKPIQSNFMTSYVDSDEDKRPFPQMLYQMVSEVARKSPSMMGWSDDGRYFYFNTANQESLSEAIKPFFSRKCLKAAFAHQMMLGIHTTQSDPYPRPLLSPADSNFASLRRQLSAYMFVRIANGRYVTIAIKMKLFWILKGF